MNSPVLVILIKAASTGSPGPSLGSTKLSVAVIQTMRKNIPILSNRYLTLTSTFSDVFLALSGYSGLRARLGLPSPAPRRESCPFLLARIADGAPSTLLLSVIEPPSPSARKVSLIMHVSRGTWGVAVLGHGGSPQLDCSPKGTLAPGLRRGSPPHCTSSAARHRDSRPASASSPSMWGSGRGCAVTGRW